MLKKMLISPAHYVRNIFDTPKTSAALNFGSLIHTMVLEPGSFHTVYDIWPVDVRPNSKEGKAFAQSRPNRNLITETEFAQARRMASKILERTYRGRPLSRFLEEGEPEVTFFFTDPDCGVECRVRHDLWHPEILFDLKTTRHPHVRQFLHAAVEMHYDLQAYMYGYAEALYSGRSRALPFVFVAAENTMPHSVSMLTAAENFIANGKAKYIHALSRYAACTQVDYWPDLGVEQEIDIEPWQVFRPELLELPSIETEASLIVG